MAFTDVIDDYSQGATGTLETATGELVNYTVTSGVTNTPTNQGTNPRFPNSDSGAEIQQDGSPELEITFDAPVSGISMTFDRSNVGEVYFVKINGVQVDLNALTSPGGVTIDGENFTADFVPTNADPISDGTHVISDSGGITSTGTFDDGSIGLLTISGKIDSVGVIGGGSGNGFDVIEVGIDSIVSDVVCFGAATEIMTPDGPVMVADLRAGDLVTTVDGSAKRVVLTQHRHFRRLALLHETRLRPVRIAAGALGNGLPHKDLTVSRQHRILVASRIAERLTGHTEVLLPASKLVGLPGISIEREIAPIDYYHILLDGHDVVLANGTPAETLFCGPVTVRALAKGAQELCPITLAALGPTIMRPARPMPDGKLVKKIVEAHRRHARPLLEEWSRVDA